MNTGILQVIANIFQTAVYTSESTEAAALGGCIKACYADTKILIEPKSTLAVVNNQS